jgi:hypothetical protein
MAELERELSEIFCKEWSWQVRELMPNRFLVRFPPHKRVADIKNLPSFNLRKGVQVEVTEWIGEMDHFSSLSEVWIQLTGIPPKWCGWRVFAQMASSFGLLLEVDWSSLFKSLHESVRLKIACRNPRRIPQERLFEMAKKLYLVSILVEGLEQGEGSGHEGDSDDDDTNNNDGADDLDDLPDIMDTDKKAGSRSLFQTPNAKQPNQGGARTVLSSMQVLDVY